MTTVVRTILSAVAAVTSVRPEEMLSELRTKPVSRARAIAMYVTREVTLWSVTRIGLAFDKDRTSVVQACQRVSQRMAQDESFAFMVGQLISTIKQAQHENPEPALDIIELAEPIAGGSRRAAMSLSTRDVVRISKALMELWDLALAAEAFVHHVSTSQPRSDDTDEARYATALGTAIVEEVDAIRAPITQPSSQEAAL